MMEPESVRRLSFKRGWCAQWAEIDCVGATSRIEHTYFHTFAFSRAFYDIVSVR